MKTAMLYRFVLTAGFGVMVFTARPVFSDGQPSGSAPATGAPAAAPVPAGSQALSAKVEKVVGNVKWAAVDADSNDPAAWQPVTAGMDMPAGTQIKTSVRSQVIVRFGDETVALVENTSLVALMELYQTAQADRVRIGLGYGAVRAGSADKGKKSKLTIETPNAVLSKEGTQGIRMAYNRGNGNYEVSLSQSGLLKVTNTLTGQSLNVSPHEFLTQAMVRWIQIEPFTRAPQMSDAFALGPNENLFSQQGGSSVWSSGGGATNGQNPATLTSVLGPGLNQTLNQAVGQQGGQTQNNSLVGNSFGSTTGSGGVFTSGNSLFSIITASTPAQPTNADLLIAYVQAHPDLVAQYGVTVDQVVTYIQQNPQIVNNLTVQDLINFVNSGQIPTQFQTQQSKLAGNIKMRWTPIKTRNTGIFSLNRPARPAGQNWMSGIQDSQRMLKSKLFFVPPNNPGLTAKPIAK